MDLIVRYWCEKENEVKTRYLTSAFLEHATALDLLTAFKENISENIMSKLIQISMDGPNVNFKFLRELKEDLAQNPERKKLSETGSCGLHAANNSFKAGIKATQWDIVACLRALYNLFKNVPSRRSDYISASGSSKFPQKFCSVRWLENGAVAQRAQEVLPNIRKYVEKVIKDKKEPNCASFKIVSDALKDALLGPKLLFFQTLAADVQPFLTKFQSDNPLAPFIYSEISIILQSAFRRFIKLDVLENNSLLDIDFKNAKNQLTAKEINIGYGTDSALRKCKNVTGLEKLQFREQCRKCMIAFVSKIMERSPIKYPLVRSITCLDPRIALQKKLSNIRLSRLLKIFVEDQIISGLTADKIDQEYKSLCEQSIVVEKMKNFDQSTNRLDHFWLGIINACNEENYKNLLFLIKHVLVLYHGNAAVERGFSVNKDCIVENQKPKSLIAQRIIYDSINSVGGIENVTINKKMILAVRNAPSLYKEALAKEKKSRQKDEAEKESKKQVEKKLKELKVLKEKVFQNAMKETVHIDQQMEALKRV